MVCKDLRPRLMQLSATAGIWGFCLAPLCSLECCEATLLDFGAIGYSPTDHSGWPCVEVCTNIIYLQTLNLRSYFALKKKRSRASSGCQSAIPR